MHCEAVPHRSRRPLGRKTWPGRVFAMKPRLNGCPFHARPCTGCSSAVANLLAHALSQPGTDSESRVTGANLSETS